MRMNCASVVGSVLLAWGNLWAGPALVLEPPTFDWGRQTENKGEYTYTFTVRNAGDEELQITRVRPGCSCTKVELKKQNLAPGESTEMTGALKTQGVEGVIQKGIILTSNDPLHQTTVANLAIRFPMNGEGLRLKGPAVVARLRQSALWAYPLAENCEAETEIQVQSIELPEGWECVSTLPLTVRPEDRAALTLTRKMAEGAEPEAFEGLPFILVTDSAKTPRVAGTLSYRQERRATPVQPSAGPAKPVVRWPMAKPVPPVAPITAPPVAPQTPAPTPAATQAE